MEIFALIAAYKLNPSFLLLKENITTEEGRKLLWVWGGENGWFNWVRDRGTYIFPEFNLEPERYTLSIEKPTWTLSHKKYRS